MSGLKHINVVMQQRYDTKTNWENNDSDADNPLILEEGEIGVESDTHKIKVGDGETRWSELPYIGSDYSISDEYKKAIEYLGYTESDEAILYDFAKKANNHSGSGKHRTSKITTNHLQTNNFIAIGPTMLYDMVTVKSVNGGFDNIQYSKFDVVTAKDTYTTLQEVLDEKPNMAIYMITYDSSKYTTDIDAMKAYLDSANKVAARGDIFIVKKNISTTDNATISDLYTSYIYDGTNWIVMSGNVSSDNVLISEDIQMAGNYTAVGNLTKTQNGIATFSTKGKTVTQALKDIFTKVLQPTKYATAPSVSITMDQSGNKVAGSSINIGFTLTFNKGSYPYGPTITKTPAKYMVELLKNNALIKSTTTTSISDIINNKVSITVNNAFSNITIDDNSTYKLKCTVIYEEAQDIANDNVGNKSNPEYKIPGGSINSTSTNSIIGYSKYYLGALTTDIENLSTSILTGSAPIPTSTNLSIPDRTNYVYIIYAISTGIKSMTILDSNNSDMDITSVFSEADTTSLPGYKVYKYAPKVSLGANTYKIKFAK